MSLINVPFGYDNEGFLYINNCGDDCNKTFEKGKIIDIDGNIICPGVIVPSYSLNEFTSRTNDIMYYSQIIRGRMIRIYWYDSNCNGNGNGNDNGDTGIFNISREYRIYPNLKLDKYKKQINFDLLEKSKCYYAILTDTKIILTHIIDNNNIHSLPELTIPELNEDLAFENHIELLPCPEPLLTMKSINSQENGLIFYCKDGTHFEFANLIYSQILSMKKPYYIPTYKYYIMSLNQYPIGETFAEYFNDLEYDIRKYLEYYPEHTEGYKIMSNKLAMYLDQFETDKDKKEEIDTILGLTVDKVVQLLEEKIICI